MASSDSTADHGDDVALMQAIVAGDAEAFRTFYGRYSPVAFALCLRILHDRADAEDVLADVFLELWEKSAKYDPSKGAPYTYLMVLTRSRAIDRIRRRRRLSGQTSSGQDSLEPRSIEGVSSSESGPAGNAESKEARSRVRETLAALESKQRQALELAYYEGLSHSQIAERTGMPLGTVKSNIRTAMAKLKVKLKNVSEVSRD